MPIRILIVALSAFWAITLFGIIWLLASAGMHPRHLPLWLSTMDPVLQLCCVLSIGAAGFCVISLRDGARRRAWIGAASAFGWGALGAFVGAAGARMMLINMNPPIPFAVYAPNYAAALLVLLVGLVGLSGTLLGFVLLCQSAPSGREEGHR